MGYNLIQYYLLCITIINNGSFGINIESTTIFTETPTIITEALTNTKTIITTVFHKEVNQSNEKTFNKANFKTSKKPCRHPYTR